MTRDEFSQLFEDALANAIRSAAQRLKRPLPTEVQIVLHGVGHSSRLLSRSDAVNALFIAEDKFYQVIDIGVVAVSRQFTRAIVIVSGHEPGPFESTWNEPPGSGPFKQIISKDIELIE